MATAFLLLSSTSASQEKQGEGSQEKPMLLPADLERKRPQIQRPRSKKGGEKAAAAQKRQPQRGLGVAQLERLRLQERWKKITEMEPADHQIQPPTDHLHQPHHPPYQHYHHQQQLSQYPFQLNLPVYDHHQAGTGASLARLSAAAPVGYAGTWGESCFLQRHRLGSPGGFLAPGAAAVSTFRNVFPDQYAVDRFQIAAAESRLHAGNQFSELSSNQKLQCFSDRCEFCIKKKRMLGERLGKTGGNGKLGDDMDGLDFLEVDHRAVDASEEMVDTVEDGGKGKKKVKEYEFFPCNGGGSNGVSTFRERTAGDASSPFSSASPIVVDLSLKLSSS